MTTIAGRGGRGVVSLTILLLLLVGAGVPGATPERAQERWLGGEYEQCLETAREALEGAGRRNGAAWRRLVIRSLMSLGRYGEAADEAERAVRAERHSVRLMMLGYEAQRQAGRADRAERTLRRINRLAERIPRGFWDPAELVALGRAALELGAEPRLVLTHFFDRAIERDPACRTAYLAAGRLALEKHDYELAADQFRQGLERFGEDPRFHHGLAEAFFPSDRERMNASLDAALHLNPRHVPSLLLRAEHRIDAEAYEAAEELLDEALAVNGSSPEGWALKAVLAHLRHDGEAERSARQKALEPWSENPAVDHLIGKKLSRKYRFEAAATHQQRALRLDPDYLPAKIQLAQDLLRLGRHAAGWELAQEVREADGYNVVAYNLMNLKDHLDGFETLRGDGVVVRMTPGEAAVYGERAVSLLEEARSELSERYGVELDEPITVELYPQQQDFAVRTFGMPGGAGYLGVCFGNVITANSPASPASASQNWEAVLWHELCHSVTLKLTAHRMPRWLSEGISVYEERRRDPAWGQHMTRRYRRMILGGELTPIGELSSAFLNPESGEHLQFAYYQSSLVVEFIVERHGEEALRGILRDLGEGRQINEAIAGRTSSLDELEPAFERFVRERAETLAPGADWAEPGDGEVDPGDPAALAEWLEEHPDSPWGLERRGRALIEAGRWEQAREPLERLTELIPPRAGGEEAHLMLARVYRELGEPDRERAVLETLAEQSADAPAAYERLMRIAAEAGDWEQVRRNAERYLAVDPMQPTAHRFKGRAAEQLGRRAEAVAAYRNLLRLDSTDPAGSLYRLARLLEESDREAAKRYALRALAEAPRYREAHRLLLRVAEAEGPASESSSSPNGAESGSDEEALSSDPASDGSREPAASATGASEAGGSGGGNGETAEPGGESEEPVVEEGAS